MNGDVSRRSGTGSDAASSGCGHNRRAGHQFSAGIATWSSARGRTPFAALGALVCARSSGPSPCAWRRRTRRGAIRGFKGALKNLGHHAGRSTIARILKEHDVPPSGYRPTAWRTCVRAHWPALIDVFKTEIATIRCWVPPAPRSSSACVPAASTVSVPGRARITNSSCTECDSVQTASMRVRTAATFAIAVTSP
jgi:hypothetical protein